MNQDLLLQRAERLCDQRGIRFTPTRRQVFRLLAAHGNAISAYDLLAQLQQTEAHAKPPTVYRALDFLLEQGFAHKVESLNANEAIPATPTSIHFGKAQTETELTLTPGKHTLQLVAGDNVHRQFEPTVASKVITVNVK